MTVNMIRLIPRTASTSEAVGRADPGQQHDAGAVLRAQ